MNIWIVTIYEPLPFGDTRSRSQRCGMLAKALLDNGHNVELWTSTFEHVRHQHYFRESKIERVSENLLIQYIDACGYQSDYSPKRLVHNRQMAKKFIETARSRTSKPDLIFAPIPSLELAEMATKYGIEKNIPVVVDIRDLWPDVYFMILPNFVKIFKGLIFITEILRIRRILRNATSITAISKTYMEWALNYAKRNCGPHDKIFNLGFPALNEQRIIPKVSELNLIKNKYSIPSNKIIFTYVGTFSDFYDIECIIETAKNLVQNENIHFMIVGSGESLDYYLNKAASVKNITMTGWVDFHEVRDILSITNVGLVAYSNIATMSLPNKPFEYMANKIPLLSSLKGELSEIIEKNCIGRNYQAGNVSSLSSEICWFVEHLDETLRMGNRAYDLFQDQFESSKIYSKLAIHIERIVNARK